jgi:iron complex outermembrane receptor protein
MGIYSGQGRLALVGGVIFLGALASTPVALCQQASAPGEQSGALEDIIVTAEKRSENLEKVPMSIVAYNSETLAEIGVQDFSSLAARIPGVTLNSAGPGRHR